MLIIPELECVVIQPPRTGSTSLRDAVMARYPFAFTPYRHMERDGIPEGYDAWRVVCTVRHPARRLVSIYRYMQRYSSVTRNASKAWGRRMFQDANRPFSEWLTSSQEVFTDPVGPDGTCIPRHRVRHPMPIARKSQWFWARPDLGPVDILKLEDVKAIEARLDIALPLSNQSEAGIQAEICPAVQRHLERHHGWDLALYETAPTSQPQQDLIAAL